MPQPPLLYKEGNACLRLHPVADFLYSARWIPVSGRFVIARSPWHWRRVNQSCGVPEQHVVREAVAVVGLPEVNKIRAGKQLIAGFARRTTRVVRPIFQRIYELFPLRRS